MTATKDELKTLGDLIDKARIGIITTTDADGSLVSRPMVVQEREFDGDLWFFTEDPSHKTEEVRANPEVNVAFQTDDGWVSISGTASIVRDQAKIDEHWSERSAAWFEQGREDPKVALLRIDSHSAEYWTVDEPKAVRLFKTVKAAATGGRPDIGSSSTVEL